jgi:hypothetical protein
MDDPYEQEIADKYGPANAVTPFQIRSMCKMARLTKNDVLYDLGSGHGRVVRLAVREFKIKRAIGIEHEPERYCHARALAKKQLTKKQLAKVDFWLEGMDYLKSSHLIGVTVAYYGLQPRMKDVKLFKQLFGRRRVRIIMKDLPPLGYAPIASSRESSTTWFFLMSYPLKHKIRNRDAWAKSFLGPKVTINDVFKYYDRQLEKRDICDRKQTIRGLQILVGKVFKKGNA